MDITSRRFTVFVHIVFWTVYFAVNFASYSRFDELPDLYLKVLLSGSVHLAICFINLAVLLPELFLKRRFSLYVAAMTPLFFGAVFLLMLIQYNWYAQQDSFLEAFSWPNFATAFISTFIVLSLTALLKFLQEWYRQQERNRFLAISQLEAEHKMLRMQVNPHFLFNALNNIYALAWKKSDAAAPAILKLAELMRYMLYDSEAKRVPLQTEVDYVKNYIGLQKLKYGEAEDRIRLTTADISSDPVDSLLFIPFVENAFKHGNLEEKGAFLHVDIRQEGDEVRFTVRNTFNPNDDRKDDIGGIGIENVVNRLKAHYPERHALRMENDGHIYTAELTIRL